MTAWSVGYNPISDKCCQWESFLRNSGSLRDDADVIFQATNELFDQNLLLTLSQVSNPTAFHAVCQFLSCDGIFFNRLVRLTVESQIQFDLPLNKLPASLCSLVSGPNGARLNWLWGHFNGARGTLSLSPLEYFLVGFCAQIYNVTTNLYANADSVGNLDCAYTAVLSELFEFFLRVDKGRNYGQLNGSFRNFTPVNTVATGVAAASDHIVTPLNLFQKRVLNGSLVTDQNLDESNLNIPSSAQFQANLNGSGDRWRSQLILSISADIWLITPTLSFTQELPKPLHLVVLRFAVKHLHRYVYGRIGQIPSEELHHRESMSHRLFAQPLLNLLLISFKRWPLDSTFRFALELWLSFVQPWRYATVEVETTPNLQRWSKFVTGHMPFYTTLLANCCDRLGRTDLTSVTSSFIAYRLIKVFALPGLVPLLNQSDRSAHNFTDLSFSNKSTASWNRQDSTTMSIETSLKWSAVQSSMLAMSRNLRSAQKELEWKLAEKLTEERLKSAKQSWMSWMFGGDEEDFQAGANSVAELRKSLDYLNFAITQMAEIFGISPPDDVEMVDATPSAPQRFCVTPIKDPPERQFDEQTKQRRLSPTGQHQLLNNLRRFGPSEMGLMADLLPLREDEIGPLVTVAKWLGDQINRRWAERFDQLYYRDSVEGRMARRLMEPPTRVNAYLRPILQRNPPQLPARVNLRKMASKRYLLGLAVLSLLLNLLFNCSPVGIVVALILVHFCLALIPTLWSEPNAELFEAISHLNRE